MQTASTQSPRTAVQASFWRLFLLTGIVAIIIFDVPIIILLPCAGLLGLIVFTSVLKSQEEQLSQ